MSPLVLLAIYCGLIVLASVAGGLVPLAFRLTHRRLEMLLSFVSGVMLGAVFLHLLPQAAPVEPVLPWVLVGFLVMFFIERFFCFHHHEAPGVEAHEPGEVGHEHQLRWAGAAIGLTLHSMINGVALAAATADGSGGAAGLGVFLAIALHKPFDSLTLGTLMAAGGKAARARQAVNLAFGLAVPVGSGLFLLGMGGGEQVAATPARAALAFSAGTFLCIALSDLLPELHFHRHDRVKLSVALLLGLAVAWGVSELEPASSHGHDEPDPPTLDREGSDRHPSGRD